MKRGALPMVAIAGLIVSACGASMPLPSSPTQSPSASTSSDATLAPLGTPDLGVESAVAETFIRPFEYRLPLDSAIAVTTATRSMHALTAGSAETYPGFGYESVSGVWGLTASWGAPARTHSNGARDTLKLRPEAFLDDLGRNRSVSVGGPSAAVLGGFPALLADVAADRQYSGAAYPDIHMGNNALIALGFPGRLIVADIGGSSFVVHIWAASEDELAAWLPVAMQIAASVRFTDAP